MMLMISPTSSRTMSVPFLSAAACAAACARLEVTGSETVKRGARPGGRWGATRAASRPSVEASGLDLGHDRDGYETVDGSPRAQTVPDVARRDVEARDRQAFEPPARTGRLRVGAPGTFDDHDRRQV